MKSIVLLSGGMDSTTVLAQAVVDSQEVLALSLGYGSRHQKAEQEAARKVIGYYGVNLVTLELNYSIFRGGSSALLGEVDVPNEEYHDPEKESPSATVVPFRNANLISTAVAIAEARGYGQVWVAVHASDAQGFAYPKH